jgi:hypothetical protein
MLFLHNFSRLSFAERENQRKLQAKFGVISGRLVDEEVVSNSSDDEQQMRDVEKIQYQKKKQSLKRGTAMIEPDDDEDRQSDEEVVPGVRRTSSLWMKKRTSLSVPTWKTTSPQLWSNELVCQWISQMEEPFSGYLTIFLKSGLTGEMLLGLKESDLKGMCINNPLHRLELYRRIRSLKTSTVSGKRPRLY